jgi:hypothetical protein
MPKKDKRPPTPSESDDDDDDYDEESSSGDYQNGAGDNEREANREHLLNYESDSSDDAMLDDSDQERRDSDDSLNLAKGLSK